MAVEARHINLFPPQFLPNSDVCNAQMDSALPLPLPLPSAMVDPFLPFYQSTVCDLASAKTSMNKADSGLTCHIPAAQPPIRKRSRDQFFAAAAESNALPMPHKINKLSPQPSSFLEQDILCQLQNQQSEIDHFISQHTEKVRMEFQKQRARQSTALISGIQEAMAKKLKEKDEEIQRMGKLNWVLQERVKSLCVENQIWRELAQTNEATANSLRSNLEQVLAHVGEDRHAAGNGDAQEDDAESCCGSNDEEEKERRCMNAAAEGREETAATAGGRMCKKCGVRESIVLLLPCRHLCLCTTCGSTVRNCPVCQSSMNATVHVNFS